jgi:hypothetical protein
MAGGNGTRTIRHSGGAPGVPDLIGGPPRTRTLDPLIKGRTGELRTGTYDEPSARKLTTPDLRSDPMHARESGQVGTNLEPDLVPAAELWVPRAVPPVTAPRQVPDRITYIDIQAHVRAHHGFTPRTGWIAHVKEANGLTLRPTHNRGASARVVPCPPERWSAIEEALRHFGLL